MHELGIVFYIIRDVKQAALENHVDHVSAVVMDIGEVSTVVPEYLIDCWQWAVSKTTTLQGTELEIVPIPATTVCNACGKTYPTVAHGKRCPYCTSTDTVLLHGNEIEIDTIAGA